MARTGDGDGELPLDMIGFQLMNKSREATGRRALARVSITWPQPRFHTAVLCRVVNDPGSVVILSFPILSSIAMVSHDPEIWGVTIIFCRPILSMIAVALTQVAERAKRLNTLSAVLMIISTCCHGYLYAAFTCCVIPPLSILTIGYPYPLHRTVFSMQGQPTS